MIKMRIHHHFKVHTNCSFMEGKEEERIGKGGAKPGKTVLRALISR